MGFVNELFLEPLGKAFIPQRWRPRLRAFLLKAGYEEVPYSVYGMFFHISWMVTLLIYFAVIYPLITAWWGGGGISENLFSGFITFVFWVIVQLIISLILISSIYFYYDMRIFNRTKKMEDVLPEFLEFISENLRGGMSFDRALWKAIRPEFGVLAGEVRLAAKKVMTGQDTEDALKELTKKYNSPMLARSLGIMIEGLRSGGEIAFLIDRIVEDLRKTKELKEEIATTSLSYVIFITFIVLVIAPGLFALSYHLLVIIGSFVEKLLSTIGSNRALNLPLSVSEAALKIEDFKLFSIGSLGVISVFSSMIISQIKNGNIRSGLVFVPVFVVVSVVFYFIFLGILGSVLGVLG